MTLKPVKIRMSLNIELLFLQFTIKDRKNLQNFSVSLFSILYYKKKRQIQWGGYGGSAPPPESGKSKISRGFKAPTGAEPPLIKPPSWTNSWMLLK